MRILPFFLFPFTIGILLRCYSNRLKRKEEEDDLKHGGKRFGKDYDFINAEEFRKWR